MNKAVKAIISALMILISFMPVHAEEFASSAEETQKAVFSADQKTASYTYYDAEEGYVTISVVTGLNGTKTVSRSSLTVKMSFKIDLSNNRIISAYAGTYNILLMNVINSSLVRNNSFMATYTVSGSRSGMNTSYWLKASVSDGTITVTHN